jgi:hypothetical protein
MGKHIDGAAFFLSGRDSGRITMHNALFSSVDFQGASVRADLRTPATVAGQWTGRARISLATNTSIPRCVTTATHRTRVSEMRSSQSRLNCHPLPACCIRTETSNLQAQGSLSE